MTRPHPAEGKARTRKPETVLRAIMKPLHKLYALGGWGDTEPHYEAVRALLAELRRSLRDARGTK